MSRFIEGQSRSQTTLFPESLDDYIGEDNPVRFIDAFVDTLDLDGLGFLRAVPKETGRPPYDPADLLKLYIYGYLNGIRSSRRLERECGRNVELLWLLRRLSPDFKTIADFRRDNREPLQGVCRQFTLLCRELSLFGGRLVAIDGTKFKAVNSKRRNYSQKALQRAIREADEQIQSYLVSLDRADQEEPDERAPSVEELRAKIAVLKEHKAEEQAKLRKLRRSGQSQVSLTDPDSRCMSQGKGSMIGYNVQTAVDSKHKLIVAHEVTSQVTDYGHLGRMAKAAKEALGCDRLDVTADKGYYEVQEVKECVAEGITPYIPKPETSANIGLGLFDKSMFRYDKARHCYWCPADQKLEYRMTREEKGRWIEYYVAQGCSACPLKARCTRSQDNRRITRHVDEDLLDAMAKRVEAKPEKVRLRKELSEHPFGTMKASMGAGNFLTRGLRSVRTELSLTVLAYNLKRVLNILGPARLLEAVT
jgi:transposase